MCGKLPIIIFGSLFLINFILMVLMTMNLSFKKIDIMSLESSLKFARKDTKELDNKVDCLIEHLKLNKKHYKDLFTFEKKGR